MANINIYGTFRSMAEDQTVAKSSQIYDDNQDNDQESINDSFDTRLVALEDGGGGGSEDAMRMASIAILGYDILAYGFEAPLNANGLAYAKELYGTFAKNFNGTSTDANGDQNLVYLPLMDWSFVFVGASKTNPKSNGLYEQSLTFNNRFVLTEDTSQVSGKSYYSMKATSDTTANTWHHAFRGCANLVCVPDGAFSGFGSIFGNSIFQNCKSLKKVGNISVAIAGYNAFSGCSSLVSVGVLNGQGVSNFGNINNLFGNCTSLVKVGGIDFSNVTSMTNTFKSCTSLEELTIYNLGVSTSLTTYDFSALTKWGTTTAGKQTLLDSLLTNSDPAQAITVQLSSATKAVYDTFTQEQRTDISNKGITITT